MLKNTLLLLSLSLLFTACAERGYKISVNEHKNTVIAQKSVDIRTDKSGSTKDNMEKMDQAVQKKQKKKYTAVPTSQTSKEEARKEVSKRKLAEEEKARNAKALEEKKAKDTKNLETQKVKDAKALEEQKAKDAKNLEAKKAKDAKALEEQKAKDTKELEAKKARDAKALEEQKAKDAKDLEAKKSRDAKALEEQKAKNLEEKRVRKAKADKNKNKKQYIESTEPIIFQPINKTYHKFGTSEIHGHVVYIDSTGEEVQLAQTKIYLLPKSTQVEYWYNNYYLKNKSNNTLNKTVAQYLNATTLNLSKNFEFYGVAAGDYFIIIESKYSSRTVKSKKVYIAKKIRVEKYKKVMAVFSKKL